MNERKKKIIIISLLVITLLAIFYVLYMFSGRGGGSDSGSSRRLLDFGSLVPNKKAPKEGTVVDPNTSDVNIPTDPNTPNDGQTDPGNINYGQNGTYTPLPPPGIYIPPFDIPTGDTDVKLPTDTKNGPCIDTPQTDGTAGVPCNDKLDTASPTIVKFSLNKEEQAELDRLNRMFARLAPYLKTEADIASELSNQEAYQDFVIEALRLSRETDIDVAKSTYIGPTEVERPFLTSLEFGTILKDQLVLEVVGYNDGSYFKISILDLIGLTGFSRLFSIRSDNDQGYFVDSLGNKISEKIVNAINNFVRKTSNNKLGTPCVDGQKVSSCGFLLFEQTLDIQ